MGSKGKSDFISFFKFLKSFAFARHFCLFKLSVLDSLKGFVHLESFYILGQCTIITFSCMKEKSFVPEKRKNQRESAEHWYFLRQRDFRKNTNGMLKIKKLSAWQPWKVLLVFQKYINASLKTSKRAVFHLTEELRRKHWWLHSITQEKE